MKTIQMFNIYGEPDTRSGNWKLVPDSYVSRGGERVVTRDELATTYRRMRRAGRRGKLGFAEAIVQMICDGLGVLSTRRNASAEVITEASEASYWTADGMLIPVALLEALAKRAEDEPHSLWAGTPEKMVANSVTLLTRCPSDSSWRRSSIYRPRKVNDITPHLVEARRYIAECRAWRAVPFSLSVAQWQWAEANAKDGGVTLWEHVLTCLCFHANRGAVAEAAAATGGAITNRRRRNAGGVL